MKAYILIQGFISACTSALDEETIHGVFASSKAAKAAVRRENANIEFEEYSYEGGVTMRIRNHEEGDDEVYYIILEEEVQP